MNEVNFLQTRSFWFLVASILSTVFKVDVEPAEVVTVGTQLIEAYNVAAPAVMGAAAYAERLCGKKRIVLGRARQ